MTPCLGEWPGPWPCSLLVLQERAESLQSSSPFTQPFPLAWPSLYL